MKLSVRISAALALIGAAPDALASEPQLRGVDVIAGPAAEAFQKIAESLKCPQGQYDYQGTCRDDPTDRPTCDADGTQATHICSRPQANWWTCDKDKDACDGGPPLGRHDCANCLKHGYSWSTVMGTEGCIVSCADGPADAGCFSPQYGHTPADCPAVVEGCTYPNGDECGDDEYCAIDLGKCALRVASQTGTCAAMGNIACPMYIMPVCGCDEKTYDNDCLAAAAGVSVLKDGPCQTPGQPREGDRGGMCPESRCEGKECSTNAILEVTCTGGGRADSFNSESTDISSVKEFKEANVCGEACGPAQLCNAVWKGYWQCGDVAEDQGEDTAAEERAEAESEEQCPPEMCKGETCLADNTIWVRCAGGGTVRILTGPTEIASQQEFKDATLCDGACDEGKRCRAWWKGSWKCGDERGEAEFLDELA